MVSASLCTSSLPQILFTATAQDDQVRCVTKIQFEPRLLSPNPAYYLLHYLNSQYNNTLFFLTLGLFTVFIVHICCLLYAPQCI